MASRDRLTRELKQLISRYAPEDTDTTPVAYLQPVGGFVFQTVEGFLTYWTAYSTDDSQSGQVVTGYLDMPSAKGLLHLLATG
jgi:hypothetical protein